MNKAECRQVGNLHVSRLKCEYLVNPLGIDIIKPRLSWMLNTDENGQKQTAYHILAATNEDLLAQDQADLWDSGKIESDETIHILYDGKSLKSRMKCFWKVRVWDRDGKPSEWSETAFWSMGLLTCEDWQAQWIKDGEYNFLTEILENDRKREHLKPATLLRKDFSIEKNIRSATAYVTGLGAYELHINGKRAGDHILAPECTLYGKRIQYQTFDVTDLVKTGENAIGVILGDGWHRGRLLFALPLAERVFGGQRGFIMRMDMEYNDGSVHTIVSDTSWRYTIEGPVRSTSIYDGEVYDARMEFNGWDCPGFIDSSWKQAVVSEKYCDAKLVSQLNEPIRMNSEVKPIALSEPTPGVYVFDLGQNLAGWCRLKIRGMEGIMVKLRHAEVLNDDGTIYMKNIRSALQLDTYIKKGNGEEVFEPHFTYHGFRYVEVSGLQEAPEINDLTACVIYSAASQAGNFKCSDDMINKLMSNIIWTQRANMYSIPTDCPQRDERAGWLGDVQAFSQTAIYNMDMAAFFAKCTTDIRESQTENGRYPSIAPAWGGDYKNDGTPAYGKDGPPAWGDSGVIVPWKVYENYGDRRLLQEQFESACNWVDFIHRNNPDLIWRNEKGTDPGDWLGGATLLLPDWERDGCKVPYDIFATGFFAHSTHLVAKMAEVLGIEEKAQYYYSLFNNIKDNFNREFVSEDGMIEGNTQGGYAIALHFDLLPQHLREKAAGHLVKAIESRNGHPTTGMLLTYQLMLELSRNNHHDEAFRMLQLRTCPSWGYMIEMGATTMWERWDSYVKGRGIDFPVPEGVHPVLREWEGIETDGPLHNPGMNSFNHWAFGAVGEWIWRYLAGINPDEANPGFKHFTIQPRPSGDLKWVKGEFDSIRGLISSSWRIEGDKFHLEIIIPANTTATVYIPAAETANIEVDGATYVGKKDGCVVYSVNSGKYTFASSLPCQK